MYLSARLGPSRIQISVQNHGNKTVRQIPLVYRLNGKEVLRDTLHKPLAPGERYLHKTSVPVFCTPTGHQYINRLYGCSLPMAG